MTHDGANGFPILTFIASDPAIQFLAFLYTCYYHHTLYSWISGFCNALELAF